MYYPRTDGRWATAHAGIPMVASSPVRMTRPSACTRWKCRRPTAVEGALRFALHADLEQPHQPAFQQLVNQMHGYDLPPPSMGPSPGVPHPGLLGPGGPGAPPSDSITHPDSTDSYVTYLESDESLPASP
ncbi:hypothetical protein JTB14_029084 [Gonioctena quinquepunctata]|nr:hypothetical protein JTB14_029084 [Gonioctena quinquepunctata]